MFRSDGMDEHPTLRGGTEKIRKEPGKYRRFSVLLGSHNLHNGETLHVNLLSLSDPTPLSK